MQRASFEDMNCSVAQCLETVGEWWSLLILRDAFLGVSRFDAFQARLGISRNPLNQRLNPLVETGVPTRGPQPAPPPPPAATPTATGRALRPRLPRRRAW